MGSSLLCSAQSSLLGFALLLYLLSFFALHVAAVFAFLFTLVALSCAELRFSSSLRCKALLLISVAMFFHPLLGIRVATGS